MQENIQLKNHFNKLMLEMPLIAILRGMTSKDIRQVTDILIDAGFKMIEVPLNLPDPFKTIEILRNHCDSDILVGAGTVINSADLKILDNIGAELIVTPNLDTNILSSLKDYNNFISFFPI